MITKSKSGAFKKAKLILALPIIGAMLLAFSCSKYVADIMETNYYPKHADSTIVKVSLWDTQNLYSGTTDRYMQKLMLVLIHHGYTINDIPLDKADHSPITFGRMSIDGVVERGSIKKRDGSPIRRDDPLFSLDEVACLYTYIRKRREESVNAHWLTQNRMPEFSADKDPYAWATYIWKNISWPESAEQKKIEGYISVQLKIKTDGGIISADVDVQTSDEQEKIKLKAEVLRVINNMPLFKPALEDGHTIDYLTLPVRVNFSMADPNIWGKIKVYKYYQ